MNLTQRFDEAVRFALELHRAQTRKGKDVPYAAHLLSVAGFVLHFGGSEDQAIAALLHDGPEDAGGRETLERIRARFGEAVAKIVEDCTDTMENPKPAWKRRKELYVASIGENPADSLLVTACDKLDNARAIVADLHREGPRTLARFSGGAETVWYYSAITTALERRAEEVTPLAAVVAELRSAVTELEARARPLAALEASTGPSLDRLFAFHLADGRRIAVKAFSAVPSNTGILEGGLFREANEGQRHRIRELAEARYGDPVLEKEPEIVPLPEISRPGRNRERLPWMACMARLASAPLDPYGDASALTLVWWQDAFTRPLPEELERAAASIDWAVSARDYEFP